METIEKIYDSESYYKFSPFAYNWVATAGVMQACEDQGCHWLLDTLASYVMGLAKVKNLDYFLVVELSPTEFHGQMDFTIRDDKGIIIVTQRIQTELGKYQKFWAICESPGYYTPARRTVVLLPDEY